MKLSGLPGEVWAIGAALRTLFGDGEEEGEEENFVYLQIAANKTG